MDLQIILNYVGIAVFASSGATVGVRKGFDLFGIATMGVLTALGGGMLRDLLLERPPYSIEHWPNITVALIAVAVATPFAHLVIRMNTAVLVLDAIGMGFFATSGAAIAVDEGASWFAAGIIGMLTAIAGGMLRDVIAGEVPYVMGPDDLYAIPAMLGAANLRGDRLLRAAVDSRCGRQQRGDAASAGGADVPLAVADGPARTDHALRLVGGRRRRRTRRATWQTIAGTIDRPRFVERACPALPPRCRACPNRPSD